MPGVSASNPVSASALQSFLPTEIATRMDNDTMPALAIAWDLTAIPADGATSGDYLLQAYLADPTYALTDAAAPLQVTLRLGGAETYDNELTIPEGTPPYPEHIVAGVSPAGTTINLFDYWVTARTDADKGVAGININENENYSKGINQGHALLFITGDYTNFNPGDWNKWTGDDSMETTPEEPYAGIVQKNLQGGYPVLNELDTSDSSLHQSMQGRDGRESLAYLFDPKMESQGKASFSDVKGLLQVDKDGYYYYNSRQNYAVFYEADNAFTLYEHPGVIPGGTSPVGQFFPFNQATADAENVAHNGASYYLMNKATSITSSINHYFGMHMSTRFIQQNGGYIIDEERKIPITYEFSGDDDVWIFIDDILVADLGGIHDMASVTINFVDGTVVINEGKEASEQLFYLKDIMGLSGATFANNTYHTLDLFYLERGNTDSNLYLRYNLVTIPESSLIKVDQVGDPVPGAEFKLYAANDLERSIATGVTDVDGSFVFRRTEDDIYYEDYGERPITIDELYNQYKDIDVDGNSLILRETKTPAGYRTNGDVGLKFETVGTGENEKVVLLSNSTWDKGAYAMPKVTATMPFEITLNDSQGNPTDEIVDLTQAENPLIFAVVFQRQGDSQTDWRPVSGDPIRGWKVHEGSTWEYVLAAARANPYIFTMGSGGRYQAEITNLPGDIATYYSLLGTIDGAEYTVGYYYSEASSLEQVTSNNTYRISALEGQDDKIDRVFSVNLYVSNIKNRLLVQKVNENGEVITDAGFQFTLYAENQVTVNDDGTVTINEENTYYDRLTTTEKTSIPNFTGGGIFPTAGKVLENGEYYLVETDAPYGYKKSEKATHIVVDNTGVYADAGEKDDGIVVLRGVGSIIHSMVQFAADDDVDATLHNIKAVLASGTTAENGITWQDPETVWEAATKVLHLQFKEGSTILDYDLEEASSMSTLDDLTFKTDEGWSKLLIRQCETHKSTGSGAWQNLGDQDLTNLFSGTVTVRVTNERVGNLKITKTVTGEGAPADQKFTFTIKNKKDNELLEGEFSAKRQSIDQSTNQPVVTDEIIKFENGTTNVFLKAGESLTILNLPYGAAYTVEETILPGFEVSIDATGDSSATTQSALATGTVQHSTNVNDSVTLAYTNDFDGSTRLSLHGIKIMEGRNLEGEDEFTFIMSPDDKTEQAAKNGDLVLPENKEVTIKGNGTVNDKEFAFGDITFIRAGEYIFDIKESLPPGVSADNPVSNGIQYDLSVATATVTVIEDDDHILTASVQYDNPLNQSIKDKAVFTNTGAYDLTIAKKVEGEMGDRDKPFTFQISVPSMANQTVSYTGGTWKDAPADVQPPNNGSLALNEKGQATFTLSHGQTITIQGLPVGTEYTITEPDAQEDGYTVTPKGDVTCYLDGHCVGNLKQETTVTFINAKGTAVPTGIRLDALPWLLAVLCGLAGCTALCVTGKTRRRKGGCGRTHG